MARAPIWLTLVLVAALPLAGCVGSSGSDAPADAANDTEPSSDSSSPPAEGLDRLQPRPIPFFFWFEYEISGPWTFTGSLDETARYKLIFHNTSEGYFTATDNEQVLIQDLFWDVDPFLGNLDEGLNPTGDPYPTLYDWPLTPGKTWESDGWGASWEFTATQSESINTPMGTWPGYKITANSSQGWQLFYDYIPGMYWFSNFMLHNQTEMVVNVDMVSHGPDYSGDMWVGESDVKIDVWWPDTWGTDESVPPSEIQIGEDATHFAAAVVRYGPGATTGALLDPDNNVHQMDPVTCSPDAPICGTFDWMFFDDPTAGTWRLSVATAGHDAMPIGGVAVRAVSMQIQQMQH